VCLDAVQIESALDSLGIRLGRPLVLSEVTTSTNDDAKRGAREGVPSGAVFLAETQTHGRGRLGRSWHSPPGENLYASFVLRPSLTAKTAPLVTLTAGLSVCDAIGPLLSHRTVALKWPNDVLVGDRKVAGILCEAQLAGEGPAWIVVGIGINVKTTSFPADIAPRATSLALAHATSLDRSALFVALASGLSARIETLERGGAQAIIDEVAARDALRGRAITVDGEKATALGIASDGALLIRRADGTEASCIAGDVQLA
jgi:BirA family biotin operon repressor/biotin-[acetyl-CoA-carboxylase] ligase